jgi:hypothetical protein
MDEDVISVKYLGGYRLAVTFRDGASGEVDISQISKFKGIMAPLHDPEFLAKVKINKEVGVLEWPNGADIDPLVLYSKATGKPIILNVTRKVKVYA